ncbi:hypothetical protein HRbin15_02039 [bacterium HR15]|nr:hypothetical protein HRbin15_02039 [bacterium HR15]
MQKSLTIGTLMILAFASGFGVYQITVPDIEAQQTGGIVNPLAPGERLPRHGGRRPDCAAPCAPARCPDRAW